MGCGSQAAIMLSANSSAVTSSPGRLLFFNRYHRYDPRKKPSLINLSGLQVRVGVRASSSSEESDCNVEECAPDKEVGKVSVEWLAGEKTKVLGTFPPRNRGWTGYVEKDTAGQTNIYSVEPAIYVAESAISSGTAGSSADGAENTKAISAGLALISIAAAASILLQVGKKNPPQIQTTEYSGPSLTYYINKFKPQEIIQAQTGTETAIATATKTETETSVSESNAPQVSKVELQS